MAKFAGPIAKVRRPASVNSSRSPDLDDAGYPRSTVKQLSYDGNHAKRQGMRGAASTALELS
jgi:hypothetical protein